MPYELNPTISTTTAILIANLTTRSSPLLRLRLASPGLLISPSMGANVHPVLVLVLNPALTLQILSVYLFPAYFLHLILARP